MFIKTKYLNADQPIISKIIHIVLLLLAFSIPVSTSITTILLTLFMLLWIIEGNYQTKSMYIWQYTACFASIFLLISLIIGSIYSSASWSEIMIFLKRMSKLIYLPFFIFYFRDPTQRKWTINALIISGFITTIVGLTYGSAMPLKNSIDTSLVITVTTFLLLHKINLQNKLYVNIIILSLSLINVFYLFYISGGKTAQLIFILLIPVFFIQKIHLLNSSKKYLILIPTTLIITILLFCGLFTKNLYPMWHLVITKYNDYKINPTKYENTSTNERNSVSERLLFYQNTLSLIKQKPLLGWGTGSFVPEYKKLAESNHTMITTNPHNEYLLWWINLGILGVGILLWWFYILFKTSFILQDYEKHILQSIILTISIGCLANSWIMDFVPGYLFIILTAVSLGALPDARIKTNF